MTVFLHATHRILITQRIIMQTDQRDRNNDMQPYVSYLPGYSKQYIN